MWTSKKVGGFLKFWKLPPAFKHLVKTGISQWQIIPRRKNTKLELTTLTAEHRENPGGVDILNLFVCVDDEERGGRVYKSSALCNTKAFREAFVNYVAFEAEKHWWTTHSFGHLCSHWLIFRLMVKDELLFSKIPSFFFLLVTTTTLDFVRCNIVTGKTAMLPQLSSLRHPTTQWKDIPLWGFFNTN